VLGPQRRDQHHLLHALQRLVHRLLVTIVRDLRGGGGGGARRS
jgi:hypothetical protein